MKVCLVQEDDQIPYKVIYASKNETPYKILHENGVFYETRDVFLNGHRITSTNIALPLSSFKIQEETIFLAVRKKI